MHIFFSCATIGGAHKFCLLHIWQDLAACSECLWEMWVSVRIVCVAWVVLFFSALCVGCVNGTNDVVSVWAPCCAGVVACPMPEVLWRVLCLFALMR